MTDNVEDLMAQIETELARLFVQVEQIDRRLDRLSAQMGAQNQALSSSRGSPSGAVAAAPRSGQPTDGQFHSALARLLSDTSGGA